MLALLCAVENTCKHRKNGSLSGEPLTLDKDTDLII